MGIVVWLGCAVVVFVVIRGLSAGRGGSWLRELLILIASTLALGALATALDFGGWNEPDWRAALFALFGSAAIAGTIRLLQLVPSRQS